VVDEYSDDGGGLVMVEITRYLYYDGRQRDFVAVVGVPQFVHDRPWRIQPVCGYHWSSFFS
jgi:hypothetical protein